MSIPLFLPAISEKLHNYNYMYVCNSLLNYLKKFGSISGQNLKASGHLGFLSFSARVGPGQKFTKYESGRAGSSRVGLKPDPPLPVIDDCNYSMIVTMKICKVCYLNVSNRLVINNRPIIRAAISQILWIFLLQKN